MSAATLMSVAFLVQRQGPGRHSDTAFNQCSCRASLPAAYQLSSHHRECSPVQYGDNLIAWFRGVSLIALFYCGPSPSQVLIFT